MYWKLVGKSESWYCKSMRLGKALRMTGKVLVLVWFGLVEFILMDPGRELYAIRLILSHPHVFRMTRATCFVARRWNEPQTIRLKGERFYHCTTDLASISVVNYAQELSVFHVVHNVGLSWLKSDFNNRHTDNRYIFWKICSKQKIPLVNK